MPTLELDDGTAISETVAICRYFDETHPEPPMFGRTAVEKALVDMWVRRIEFPLMSAGGQFLAPRPPAHRRPADPVQGLRRVQHEAYSNAQRWLDRELAGRDFIAGDAFSMADICALSTVDFADWIGLDIDAERTNLTAWHQRIKARPSARA